MPEISDLQFPQDFLFGSATAAFQVEGEQGERKTDWDVFLKNNPHIIQPHEKGPQWWAEGNAQKDINSMHQLGLKMQRLSIEWGRIEPEKGKINQQAISRYKQIIAYIKSLDMIPMVTINHYVLPEWVSQKGSWKNKEIIPFFLHFVHILAATFPEVRYWITLNEPNFLLEAGYLTDSYPPQAGSFFTALTARSHMIAVHKKSFSLIKKMIPASKIGVAFAMRWYPPENPADPFENIYAKIINYLDNNNFIDAMQPADFIGCNFYTGYFLNFTLRRLRPARDRDNQGVRQTKLFGQMKKPGSYMSDYDWPIVPDFLLQLLRSLYKSFKSPIIITENGLADEHDIYRSFYILTHLVAIWRALQEGIPVKHYIHWSTVDNLEWLEG